MDRFAACFEDLEDPTTGNAALHDFHTLLIIALCTVLCGGQGCVDMALFAQAKEPFLREFLDLKNGPPSHDTFSRLFRRLDPDQFRVAFQRFMTAFSETCQGVIAIDGKVLRRSFDRASKSLRCTYSAPEAANWGWCWRRSPRMPRWMPINGWGPLGADDQELASNHREQLSSTQLRGFARVIAFQNAASSLRRNVSSHPARLNFPRRDPLDPSLRMTFNAM